MARMKPKIGIAATKPTRLELIPLKFCWTRGWLGQAGLPVFCTLPGSCTGLLQKVELSLTTVDVKREMSQYTFRPITFHSGKCTFSRHRTNCALLPMPCCLGILLLSSGDSYCLTPRRVMKRVMERHTNHTPVASNDCDSISSSCGP